MRYANSLPDILFIFVANADIGYQAQIIRPNAQAAVWVRGVSDYGVVTGSAVFPPNSFCHCFRWTSLNGMTDLGTISGGRYSEGFQVNNNDRICGWSNLSTGEEVVIYWTEDSGFTQVAGFNSFSPVINDSGWIAGQYTVGQLYGNAALWRPGIGYTIIGDLPGGPRDALPTAINNGGVVCGIGYAADGHRAFLWDQANGLRAMAVMPDGSLPTDAIDMNNVGQVIGGSFSLADSFSYLWDPVQGYSRIDYEGVPPTGWNEAVAINDRTEIVGTTHYAPELPSWVYDAVRGFRDLRSSVDPCDGVTTPLLPVDINNLGQILCYTRAFVGDPPYGYLLTPYVVGDVNEDNVVDLSDLAVLLANFGRTGDADYAAGDLDCDADVDLQDLATQLASFGESYP